MIATLKFDLNDPDEQRDFDMMLKARKAFVVIEEFDNYLRNKIKYADAEMSADQYMTFNEIREKLTELRNDYNILEIE